MKTFIFETRARFSDTDLYGVVHHSNYFRWLEEARIQIFEEIAGISLNALENENIRFPVISIEGKYKKSVKAREKVYIKTCVGYSGIAKLTFKYEITDQEGKVCFVAKTEHAVTQNNKMLLKMPDKYDEYIKQMIMENEKEC